MAIQIEDGGGSGRTALVATDNKLETRSTVRTQLHDISKDNGNAYSWASGTYSYTGGDTILLVKNTGNLPLDINKIWLSSDTDTRVVIHLPAAEVTPTGTTIVGTNLNTASGNTAEAIVIRDETDNTQGTVLWSGEIMATDSPYEVCMEGAIIIGKNKSIGIDFVTTGTTCDVTIVGDFE